MIKRYNGELKFKNIYHSAAETFHSFDEDRFSARPCSLWKVLESD